MQVRETKIAASAVEGSSLPVLCFCRKGVCWWPIQTLLEKCDPTHRWDQQLQLPPPPQDAIHWACSHLFLRWRFAAWRFNSPDCFLPDLLGKFAASNQCERHQPVQEVDLFRCLAVINLNFTNTKMNCNEQDCNLCCPTPWKREP